MTARGQRTGPAGTSVTRPEKLRFWHAWEHVAWDARSGGPWAECLDGAAGLVNLVGRTVDCVKTPDHCDEILRSRVEATRILGVACRAVAAPPPVWVQMSTALSKLAPLARLGLGGTVGSGRQGMSWIHETDMNRLFERGLTDPAMEGIYVASSPNPVRNAEFMRCLRRAVPWPKVPLALPAFAWMVRIAAPLVLRTDPEIALYGRYVKSRRLEQEGFTFRYPHLPEALAACFAPGEPLTAAVACPPPY